MKTLNIASSSPSFNHIRKIPEIKKAKKAEISIEKRPVVTPISNVAYSLRQFTFYLPANLPHILDNSRPLADDPK
ncbi:hypothetical protein [Burkholderia multivorans]|uniref:hypothetical protein n=1 Tax=Burkholderia multivorans TaxID=87883 RepID=UPI0021BEF040|nr:hypothetical protein [Burkholderia multivorans]